MSPPTLPIEEVAKITGKSVAELTGACKRLVKQQNKNDKIAQNPAIKLGDLTIENFDAPASRTSASPITPPRLKRSSSKTAQLDSGDKAVIKNPDV